MAQKFGYIEKSSDIWSRSSDIQHKSSDIRRKVQIKFSHTRFPHKKEGIQPYQPELKTNQLQRSQEMIVKYRSYPLKTLKEEALSRRLPPNHTLQPKLKDAILTGKAGYKGEKDVDFYLNLLPSKKFMIFQDIRLPRDHYFFQIDSLLITQSFILIIEIKNMAGSLFFDAQHNQFYRIHNGKKERFKDPLLQVRRHRKQLFQWLAKHKYPLIPIEYLYVNSNDNSLFESSNNNPQIFDRILHSEYLLEKIYKMELAYKSEHLTSKEQMKLSKQLLKEHSPKEFEIQKHYQFDESELIQGVFCPQCGCYPMHWKSHAWNCTSCHHRSKTAHKPALHDYQLLVSPTISNRCCREFLKLYSSDTARYHLKTFHSTGKNKGKKYILSLS